jgi:hypothetical protein
MKKNNNPLYWLLLFLLYDLGAYAQIDSSLFKPKQNDTLQKMNMDAVYDRPFLGNNSSKIAIGGYAEVNWQHIGTDGISEGHQFEMRRMTLFVSSGIGKRIKFLSELELEDGGKNLAIEFAAIDIELHALLNIRGGIILNPIGAFNQNHDGPKWEFTDRPIVSTQLLPATWSNAGFGLFGKKYKNKWMLGYELYLSGGFDNSIIDNTQNKTSLPVSKDNPNRFESTASGLPLYSAKVAAKHRNIGEIGLSYMGGTYNTFIEEGQSIAIQKRAHVFAIDMNTQLKTKTKFITEMAFVSVQIPNNYLPTFGSKQWGGFIDIIQPVYSKPLWIWEKSVINLAMRLEFVDWNTNTLTEDKLKIGDELWSIMPGISLRPFPQTIIRFNYRYQHQYDFLNNPANKTAGFNFGISSYF